MIQLKGTVLALLAAVLLIGGFTGGWVINGWRHGAGEAEAAIKALQDSRADLEERVESLNDFNAATAASELEHLQALRETKNAIRGIRDEIAKTNVGGARITADGDRLRLDAYRAATSTDP